MPHSVLTEAVKLKVLLELYFPNVDSTTTSNLVAWAYMHRKEVY